MDPGSEEARLLSRKIAANIGDYASLRLILGIDPPEFAKFYPDMDTVTPSTIDTIDTFLEKYDSKIPAKEQSGGVPYNIEIDLWDTSTEPALTSERIKQETNKGKPQNSRFENKEIEKPGKEPELIAETEAEKEEQRLSELIREHKYEEALKLIELQNLNNPRKSIYFAHQMRFLKKLMALESYKTKKINKNQEG